ncbi:hypothetical protein L209DRAFT_685335, partial [Thermothelomyces heterothallicus CBS 203.75]
HSQSIAIQAPEPAQMHQPHVAQPPVARPMDAQRPHPEGDADAMSLRGGRSRACPGRFCFIIPCPLPCDCCII